MLLLPVQVAKHISFAEKLADFIAPRLVNVLAKIDYTEKYPDLFKMDRWTSSWEIFI